MKPWKILTIGLWLLAIASVAAYFAANYSAKGRLILKEPESGGLSIEDTEWSIESIETVGPLPKLFPTPQFTLVEHTGEPFDSASLKGKPWVGFIFLTHCPTGACPVMVGKMGDLQDALPEGVELVSFSVDPERDTPEAMAQYVETVTGEAPSDRWHLLTGESREQMNALAHEMKLSVGEDFGHSTQFLLVDADGLVRGAYGNNDPSAMARLEADAKRLLEE